MAYEPTVYAPSLKRRNALSDPYSPDDAESDMESDSPEGSSPDARSVTSGAAGPRPLSPSPYEPYLSGMSDISQRLMSAYQAPRPGAFRQIVGALLSKRNPQLGGLVSGELQRQRTIEPLQQEYNLLASGMSSRLQMAKDLAEANAKRYVAPRGGGVYDINQGAYAPNAGPTPQRETTPDQQTFDYLTSTPDAKLGRPLTEPEALERINSMKQKPPSVKQGLDYDPGTGIPISYTDEKGQRWDVNDPALPQAGKQLVKNANDAHAQHVKEQADAQARASALAGQRQEASFTRQDVREHDKSYVQPAEQVEKSYQMMNDAYNQYQAARAQGKELPTGAQSMLALSTHLSTTFGNVKGSRVTKDMIREHLGARGISDSALVAVQKLTNGDVLSPDQWNAFHDLISDSRKQSWNTAVREAKRKNIPVDFLPGDLQGLTGDASSAGKYARPTAGVVVEQ